MDTKPGNLFDELRLSQIKDEILYQVINVHNLSCAVEDKTEGPLD